MEYFSIYNVGEIITYDEFYNQRLQAAAWVHFSDFVEKVLNGNYDYIFPLHIELCSTYICNFNCPWCSCRKSRMREDIEKKSLNIQEIKRILDECKKKHVGIQWTGGEPLLNKATIKGIVYGTEIGISQCLFTNGSLMNEYIDNILLESNLEFIRISLNCANQVFHSRFHGNILQNLSKSVLINIEKLCKKKIVLNSKVKIGISIVVDSKNIDDLFNTINYIEYLSLSYAKTLNYVVIRAVNDDFEGIKTEKNSDFLKKYSIIIDSINISKFKSRGIDIIFPNHLKCSIKISNNYQYGCSVFSEIAPDGSMFLCSDKYGNIDFSIGNILTDSLSDIWDSSHRKNIQDRHKNCFISGRCPNYSRGWYFNSIFSQIEELKKNGDISLVKKWIFSLQKTVPQYKHSFFI